MNDRFKFRGKATENIETSTDGISVGEWVEGYLSFDLAENTYVIITTLSEESGGLGSGLVQVSVPVDIKSVGSCTTLKDKSGKLIYEKDIVRWREPYRKTQTHYGDNIPNGEYTEPLEPGIEEYKGEVKFSRGVFYVDQGQDDNEDDIPMVWDDREWDLDSIKNKIDSEIWDDPDEGDLQYLLTECAKVETPMQLVEYLRGFEIIGNIYENPELLNEK